ncbi:MAG: rdgB [Caproiciproducens sp.]|nr:rdgB [Caproiciproducens sp.]
MATFIIATHNKHKLSELERILTPLKINAVTAQLDEVEETGATFAENAFLKANAACRQTGMPAVADDSGLMVDALNDAPGVYSARYAGEGASDMDRIQKLLLNLKDVPKEKRNAKFVCSICCVYPNGDIVTAHGECAGTIGFEPQGSDGFGYDPIFFVNGKSFAQLTAEEKDKISHRGRALEEFAAQLQQIKEQNQ